MNSTKVRVTTPIHWEDELDECAREVHGFIPLAADSDAAMHLET